MDENGKVKSGLKEQLDDLKKSDSYLFIPEDNNNGNKSEIEEDFPKNHSSILRGIPGIGNFFKSEGSFAKLRIDNQKSICCFGPDNTIIAITSEGSYYQAKIDLKKGGDCQIIKQEFLNEINKK